MLENSTVTVLVSTELIAELRQWSAPVQIRVVDTPGVGTGYELEARRVDQVIAERGDRG
jgi:hypothetical protein